MRLSNNRFLIKSGGKFVPFVGIRTTHPKRTIKVTLSDQRVLVCSPDHMIAVKNTFKRVSQLKVNDCIDKDLKIVSVEFLTGLRTLYDVVQSFNHQYDTNGITSHNCSFVGSSNTLIDSSVLKNLVSINPIKDINGLRYFKYPDLKHQYVMTVDVSRGRGLDYSTFTIFDISVLPYEIVCTFKHNEINASLEYPVIINKIGRMYNNALILIENNDLGEAVANSLWYDWEYDNVIWTNKDQISGSGVIGIVTTRKVKSIGCQTIKNIIENHQIILNDFRIIQELEVFVRQKKGLYGAQDTYINDDLCQNLWLFGWLTQQNYFVDLTNVNTNQIMGKSFVEQVDDYLPIGFRVDGTESYESDHYAPLDNDQRELLGWQ